MSISRKNNKILLFVFAIVIACVFLCASLFLNNEKTEDNKIKASSGFTKSASLSTSSSRKSLTSGYVYYANSDVTFSSGMYVSSGGTAVLYIPAGVRVTAKGGAGIAGINVPSGTTLIIVGDGFLNATGGKGSSGYSGGNGGNGYINTSGNGTFHGGLGGYGGNGGRGAGAGIGGNGGYGGSGGNGGSYSTYSCDKGNDYWGEAGSDGSKGSNGDSMGSVYILGNITVSATGGGAGSSGGSGGSAGSNTEWDAFTNFTAAGGAGGGGGGAGSSATNIGGGGRGGGGGGGGAAGGVYTQRSGFDYVGGTGGKGGEGIEGETNGSKGTDGSYKNDSYMNNGSRPSGGSGGSGGDSNGGNGTLYIQNSTSCSDRNRDCDSDGKLSELQYTVTFNKADGSGGTASQDVWLGQTMDTVSIPSRSGYTFLGYYSSTNGGGTQYYNSSGVATKKWDNIGDKTLYAYWRANDYTVTFDKQNGSGGTSSTTATYASSMPSISVPSRSGYTFQGYYSSENGGGTKYYNSNGTSARTWNIASNTTLYAYWTINTYTITFDTNGGDAIGQKKYNIKGDTADSLISTLPTPTRKGYGIAEDVEKYGVWQVISSSGNGNWTYNARYKDGLSLNGKYGSPTLKVVSWQANTYQVTLDKQGGNGGTGNFTVTYDSYLQSEINKPSKSGYTFEGYYNGSTKYYDSSGKRTYNNIWTIEGGITLNAHWSPITYNITFNTNGANSSLPSGISNPSQYNIEGSNGSTTNPLISTLPLPTRTGYGFTNWSVSITGGNWGNGTYSSGATVSGKYGDVTLRANWYKKPWTLTFNPNRGTVSESSRKVLIDEEYGKSYNESNGTTTTKAFPTPTRPGYIFNGWYTSSSGGSPVTTSTKMTTEGATIYAQWLETWASNITEDDKPKWSEREGAYTISTAEQLAYLAREVQKGETFSDTKTNERKYFVQTAPINLSGKIWLPIGGSEIESGTTSFGGIYNGRGFAIIGLETQGEKFNNVGLFGRTSGAKLMNVYVLNADVKGKNNVGILVGENAIKSPLEISCCFAKGVVNGTTNVGGLVGNDSTGLKILNSGFTGNVTNGSIMVGKMSSGLIRDCYAEVNSNISFCGSSSGVTIDACVFETSSGKYYYSDKTPKNGITFDGWTTYQGKPLPSGLTWIGGVSTTGATLNGYTKVD